MSSSLVSRCKLNISQCSLLQKQSEILEVLKRAELEKADKDVRSQFWETYEVVAEEVDSEFLERYNGDIDIIPTFVRFLSQNSLRTIQMQFRRRVSSQLSPPPS